MKLSGAETVIRASVNKNLDVGALARGVGLSASYFRRLFRESRGVSPSVFHRDLRVREAVRLLADHGMNVSETADALGFSNIHNFSRAVKAVTGLSPKKYCGKP
jgi:AraC-like DNA-binding protein